VCFRMGGIVFGKSRNAERVLNAGSLLNTGRNVNEAQVRKK